MKHTPEPWGLNAISTKSGQITHWGINGISREGKRLTSERIADATQEANAQRIVDCVNACKGINPAAVPELIEALVSVVKTCEAGVIHVNETGKPQWSALDQMKQIARNALAKSKSKSKTP